MTVGRIICILIGYAIGLFQTGYIYGKTQHIDIREHGSGNAGTTNTLRTLGFKAGAITFAGDCGKAILAIFISWLIFHAQYPEGIKLLGMYAGLGAVLGHNYPFYMKFKGRCPGIAELFHRFCKTTPKEPAHPLICFLNYRLSNDT